MKTRGCLWIPIWILFCWIGAMAHAFAGYVFTTLDDPATSPSGVYNGTYATGISGSNIVGVYYTSPEFAHGFQLTGTTYTTFDAPSVSLQYDGDGTYFTGISGSNTVGYYTTGTTGYYSGFLLSGSTFTVLDEPDGTNGTYPTGISGNNIVGYFIDSNDAYHGFIFDGTSYTQLDDPLVANRLLAGTELLGISGTDSAGKSFDIYPSQGETFLYSGTTYRNLHTSIEPAGISGGTIVGWINDSRALYHSFVLSDGRLAPLIDPLGATGTQVLGIDGDHIVGTYSDRQFNNHGFLGFLAGANAGRYTLLLSATGSSAAITSGTGYATMAINSNGAVAIGGKLPDGESFTIFQHVTYMLTGNQLIINKTLPYPFVTTRNATGILSGALTFVTQTGTSDLNGTLTWTKPEQTKGDYPAAIDTTLNVIGSLYIPPSRDSSFLPNFTSGTLELTDTSTLSASGTNYLDQPLTLSATNLFKLTPPIVDNLRFSLTPATGVFKGTFLYPAAPGQRPKLTGFAGVLFQDQAIGAGLFIGPNGSGAVTLSP